MLRRAVRKILPARLWNALRDRSDELRRRCAPDGYGPLLTLPLEVYGKRYGYRKVVKGYDGESSALAALERVKANTMISYERAVTLFQQARYLEETGIEGAFVECGVWKGGAAGLMALANLAHGKVRREIHLFDSFEGLPEPSHDDGEKALAKAERKSGRKMSGATRLVPVGWDRASREESESLLAAIGYPAGSLHYHVGWFQETLPKASPGIGPIALLRLDADFYESTKICLEVLYPAVVSGGFVVMDDYGHFEGCRKAVDEYFAARGLRPYLHHIDYTGRYLVKS